MGVFERLGEEVERFKQEAVDAQRDSADYRCRNCGARFYHESDACPECGSTEVERLEETAESKAGGDGEIAESEAGEETAENAAGSDSSD